MVRDLGLRRAAYYRLSPAWRRRSRRIAFAPLDAWTAIRGRPSYNGIPLPLRGEIFTGGGDFLTIGMYFLERFQRLGGLQPSDDVLEVGSGLGRMAIPLTGFLDGDGSYTGFDIVADAVQDCQLRISSRFPAFTFVYLPLMNDLYTETGAPAMEATFPFEDDSFDFAFATSVFTHMTPPEIERYLHEIRRVLRPGGKFLATLFYMDEPALRASPQSDYRFPHQDGDAWYMAVRPRSGNVAISASAWDEMVRGSGWHSVEMLLGSWSGRSDATGDLQDTVILG